MDAMTERTTTLANAWRWWGDTLAALDDLGWQRDTRLEGWNVAALAGHHGLLVRALAFLATQPIDRAADVQTAAEMLGRFNAPDGVATTSAPAVAEMARQQAAALPPAELRRLFTDSAPETIAALRAAGPVVVEYFGNGGFPLAEVVSIATLEAVVHGLDLARALDANPASLPRDAVKATVLLLAELPDAVSFIEAATGRSLAIVLPVLR